MFRLRSLKHRVLPSCTPKRIYSSSSIPWKPSSSCSFSTATTPSSQPNIKYVTIPIFYVNGTPHIGHLYTALLGDAISRWNRTLLGTETKFIGGTDEHGIKVQEACFNLTGTSDYQAYCDNVSDTFANMFEQYNIQVDGFFRTTGAAHQQHVANMWTLLQERDFLYRGVHEGYYSKVDEAFFPPNQLSEDEDGNMVITATGSAVVWASEENYIFRLSHFQKPLLDWLLNNPTIIKPQSQYNQVISFLQDEKLEDLSVSRLRAKAPWGIAVPDDADHSIYVWLDALNIYLSAILNPEESMTRDDIAERLVQSNSWPPDVQILGKDILRFHSIYWPAFLMAADLPLPKQIISHGHWTVEGNFYLSIYIYI